jgi:hypothetical protein
MLLPQLTYREDAINDTVISGLANQGEGVSLTSSILLTLPNSCFFPLPLRTKCEDPREEVAASDEKVAPFSGKFLPSHGSPFPLC